MNREALALALLSVVAGIGCDGLKGSLGGTTPDAAGTGGSGGSASCTAVTNPDGSVCKRCFDASGVVIEDICAPAPTGSAGTTGSGGTGAAGTTGTGGGAGGAATGAACTKIEDGGPTSCKDTSIWKTYGADACARMNLTLTDIAWGAACGDDHFQTVTYVCCGACTTTVDADGQTCTTCTDATGSIVSAACSGGDVTCELSTGPDGAQCKTCRTPDGKIFSAACSGGSTGATEICDVRTNPDGSSCKVCYEPDGSTISSCPPDSPTP